MARNNVTGLSNLLNNLRLLNGTIETAASDISLETAQKVQNSAQEFAPVDTGKLVSEIVIEKLGPTEYEVVSGAPYSAAVEYGSRGRAGEFYMKRAFEKHKNDIERDMQSAINRSIN
jgi:HK97 gp10 family phage protein